MSAIERMVESLNDSNAETRYGAVRQLGELGAAAEAAVPQILALLLQDPDEGVRAQATQAVSQIASDSDAVVTAIVEALNDTSDLVRHEAVTSLARIGPGCQAALAGILSALQDSNAEVRFQAVWVLGGLASRPGIEGAVPGLIAAIDGTADEEVKLGAMHALATIGCKAAVLGLTWVLKHPDPDHRYKAALLLGRISERAVPAVQNLAEALHDDEPDIRGMAAWALGTIGQAAAAAIPALEMVWEYDPQPEVRAKAKEALRRIRYGHEGMTY